MGARPSRGGTTSGGRGGPSTGSSAWGALAVAALLALATWLGLAATDRFPFPGWLYHFAWYSGLVAVDAWLARRHGRAPWLGRPRFALSLWLWSVPVWLLFELLNLRVANWYYVLAERSLLLSRVSAALAFGTVLPAIFLGHRVVAGLGWFARARGPGFRVGTRLPAILVLLGALFLALALWRPSLFFPLIWGSTTLLIEPWNWRRDRDRSLLADLARGEWTRPLRLLAAGVGIGLVWETLNAFAATRWIYTVPGLEEAKLFEMPALGYLGFPVFALDGFVLYQALVNLGVAVPGWDGDPRDGRAPRSGRWRRALAFVAAVGFSAAVLAGVDRYTIDSREPRLVELPGATAEVVQRLEEAGYDRVAGVTAAEPETLAGRTGLPLERSRRLVEGARVARLRGIGTENAAALAAAGIDDLCELAAAEPGAVTAAIRALRDDPRAGSPRRVRVWIRAARAACERPTADP